MMQSPGILYVMAKAPVPGRVKTRLCPPLDADQAAALATAFVQDLLGSLRLDGVETRLAIDEGPPGDASTAALATLERLAHAAGVAVERQGGGDLGERMARLVARGLSQAPATVLVGSDVPDLPPAIVSGAFGALARADAVLAASADGGYVLVGATRRHGGGATGALLDALFSIDAAWSSPDVFSATCASLAKHGCSYETVDAWDDVDDAAALGRLAVRLDSGRSAAAPVTHGWIEGWRRQGVRF
jgi:rSAM/selenodomain-associated transferase 1